MAHFLTCKNPCCRFVLDVHLLAKESHSPRILLAKCPECGTGWSDACPFCGHTLSLSWHGKLPHCAHCRHKLRAEAAAAA